MILGLMTLAITSCQKEGDRLYLSGLEEGNLVATASNVVLAQETSKQIALSFAWSTSALTVSDPAMHVPNLLSTRMQASTTNNFAPNNVESVETSLSKAYTGAELNTLAKSLGLTPGTATEVFFRLSTRTGSNMAPVYSNIVSIKITPYVIDMSVGFILDSKMADNGLRLYSPQSNGSYTGFMGAVGWYGFYLKEGDGTLWGNDGRDGGPPFLLSSSDVKDERWNCWFPGISGCYFVNVSAVKKQWSALLIPALTVSGGVQGTMTFDRPNVKWVLPFTATQAGALKVKVSGIGKQYDFATGTDDAKAKDTPVAFAPSGENITFGTSAADITLNVAAAGDYTLIIDLSNPRAFTVKAEAGSVTPPEVRKEIFLAGIDDLLTGGWNFNNKLRLYNEDEKSYSGVAYAHSEWGYNVFLEADNWDDKYTFATGTATEGTMEFKGAGGNLPAPAQGLYFFDVSLKALTYKLTLLGNEIYYAGVNDDWTFHPLAATATKGVFSGTVTLEKASEWGFKLYLLNGNWELVYGGDKGVLYFKGNGITDDKILAPGTYTLTVDLVKGTYTINK